MRHEIVASLRPAIVLMGLFTLLTGVLYPTAIWIACHDIFAFEAEGSLLTDHGRVVGSERIGQEFRDPRHLWGRLSATSGHPYNAQASSGSNLGPLNPALETAVKARVDALRAADPTLTGPIPVDLVTASGSGLDPDISLAAAHAQVGRIARARGTSAESVRAIIDRHAERPWLDILGEARVNVLAVNLELDGIPASDRGGGR